MGKTWKTDAREGIFGGSKGFVGEENAVTEAPRVLTVGRGKARASETRSNERRGLKGEEFYEESNFSPKHGQEAWKNRETRGNA